MITNKLDFDEKEWRGYVIENLRLLGEAINELDERQKRQAHVLRTLRLTLEKLTQELIDTQPLSDESLEE